MIISENKVVSINYTVKTENGEIIDSTEGKEPLSYIHGKGYILPGVEDALEGKEAGDSISIEVKPEDGYGYYYDELVFKVDKEKFSKIDNLEIGTQVQMSTENGPAIFLVTEITDDMVTIDGNHPLAGKTLFFDISVAGVRDATKEELDHGHIH